MKKDRNPRRSRTLCGIMAAILSAIMLMSVSCTANDIKDDLDHMADKVTGVVDGTSSLTDGENKPLDPDAGTVNPDAEPGDPPAGTGEGKGIRSRRMW